MGGQPVIQPHHLAFLETRRTRHFAGELAVYQLRFRGNQVVYAQ